MYYYFDLFFFVFCFWWLISTGYISVKTTALAEDCAVAKMAKLVEEAQNSRSKTQRFIDKCAKFYTPGLSLFRREFILCFGFKKTFRFKEG